MDEPLRRREFLQRTAMTAGLAGMASVLPAQTLIAEAASRQRRSSPLPSPRNMPVDTIVVLMMENRSFDHYLGWRPDVDGRQAGLTYVDTQGVAHQTYPLAPDFQGCGHLDPDHSWSGARIQLDGGRMDGFLKSHSDELAIGYYKEGDLGFIDKAAQAFTTFDRFHCSLLTGTYPNREYMHAAQSYGQIDNVFPGAAGYPDGFPWETTIWHALERKHVSHRYFYSDLPISIFWGSKGIGISSKVAEFYERAAKGTLPHVSFVDPFFGGLEGEDKGTSGDEHPHGDVRTGQAFMSDVVHAIMESPQYHRTALFVVYDEWGGFFEHVVPPRVPDIRANADIDRDFGRMGFRIPAFVVSPYARRAHVSHTMFGFESILKMIEYRFGLAPLTRRDAKANNIATAFDWHAKPHVKPAVLPRPAHIVSQACPAPPGATTRARPHDLERLATEGHLDRYGLSYRPPARSEVFR